MVSERLVGWESGMVNKGSENTEQGFYIFLTSVIVDIIQLPYYTPI